MALGDGIRRNIAHVDPTERELLKAAFVELNERKYPGNRTDSTPGGVSWWFKQDEIHKATHVHGGPEFIPWHRQLVNGLEELLRQINPQLSLHYWDWTQDPRDIPNANLGGGNTGSLNLFTADFMGYGGTEKASIGEPWLAAKYYGQGSPSRPSNRLGGNPADPPLDILRSVGAGSRSPATVAQDQRVRDASDYKQMRELLEDIHNSMHGFVNMGSQHVSFRDPFVFLLHCNVDRLFAEWQTMSGHPERLNPSTVYGTESNLDVQVHGEIQNVNHSIEPWAGGKNVRPWSAPDNQPDVKTYKHPSIVIPPLYDTVYPNSILGKYECHKYDNGGKNDWHYVTLTKVNNTTFKWTNRAGVSWTLSTTSDKINLNVGPECPYFNFDDGTSKTQYTQATLVWENNKITGILGPWGEMYDKSA